MKENTFISASKPGTVKGVIPSLRKGTKMTRRKRNSVCAGKNTRAVLPIW